MRKTERTAQHGYRARRLLPAVALGILSGPLAAMEELTVDGAADAAAARAQEARFEAQMDRYVQAVGADFKTALETELRRSVEPGIRSADAGGTSRG